MVRLEARSSHTVVDSIRIRVSLVGGRLGARERMVSAVDVCIGAYYSAIRPIVSV